MKLRVDVLTNSFRHSLLLPLLPYPRSSDEKEAAYTTINKLNTEQKKLNEQISRVTNQAASAERDAREKEEAFNRDQESSRRKNELNELLTKCRENETEFDRKLTPLRTKLMQAESDRGTYCY